MASQKNLYSLFSAGEEHKPSNLEGQLRVNPVSRGCTLSLGSGQRTYLSLACGSQHPGVPAVLEAEAASRAEQWEGESGTRVNLRQVVPELRARSRFYVY